MSYEIAWRDYPPDLAVNEEELTYGKYGMLKNRKCIDGTISVFIDDIYSTLNRVDQDQKQVEIKTDGGKTGVTEQLKKDLMKR